MNLEKFNFSIEKLTSVDLRVSNHFIPLLLLLHLLLSCGGQKGSIFIFHLETSSHLHNQKRLFLPSRFTLRVSSRRSTSGIMTISCKTSTVNGTGTWYQENTQKMSLKKSIAMGLKALQSEGVQEEFLGGKLSLCVK